MVASSVVYTVILSKYRYKNIKILKYKLNIKKYWEIYGYSLLLLGGLGKTGADFGVKGL